jgi:hypothetical protein
VRRRRPAQQLAWCAIDFCKNLWVDERQAKLSAREALSVSLRMRRGETMRRLAALYASLQAVMIGWLAGGGSLPSSAQNANPADDGAWAQAQALGTIEAYENYLGQLPVGLHASQAFRCIVELTVEATEGTCVASPSAGGDPLEGAARGLSSIDVYWVMRSMGSKREATLVGG